MEYMARIGDGYLQNPYHNASYVAGWHTRSRVECGWLAHAQSCGVCRRGVGRRVLALTSCGCRCVVMVRHAASVFWDVQYYLRHTPLHIHATPLQKFSALIAAAVHDFLHPYVVLTPQNADILFWCLWLWRGWFMLYWVCTCLIGWLVGWLVGNGYALLSFLVSRHRGVNNTFLIEISHPIAIAHNDSSVLERYHVGEAFAVAFDMQQDNPFLVFAGVEYVQLRRVVIDMVLMTVRSIHSRSVAPSTHHVCVCARALVRAILCACAFPHPDTDVCEHFVASLSAPPCRMCPRTWSFLEKCVRPTSAHRRRTVTQRRG